MHEVFRHWDTATVGLVNSILEEAGVHTVLRNWEGSNIVEIPIPVIYPNICVLNTEDFEKAKELIEAFMNHPNSNGEDGIVIECGEFVDHEFAKVLELWGNEKSSSSLCSTIDNLKSTLILMIMWKVICFAHFVHWNLLSMPFHLS